MAEDDGSDSGRIEYQNLLTGFSLYDDTGKFRGTIISVTESRYQWLANIRTDRDTTFLLPVHEDLIRSIDEEGKAVIMVIPEGLENIG